MLVIEAKLSEADTPEDDLLLIATSGKTYFQDQLHLFEAAGNLVCLTKTEAARQLPLLEAIAGPLMASIGFGLQKYREAPQDLSAVLQVHYHLLALGNFAKGFPQIGDIQLETVPYQPPFKQMTEALLQALDVMKTQRVVRDSVSTIADRVRSATDRCVGSFRFLPIRQCYRINCSRTRAAIRLTCRDRIPTNRARGLHDLPQSPHASFKGQFVRYSPTPLTGADKHV